MTKRTPAPPEAGPVAPDKSDQDALLRQLMDDVLTQPPSEREADLVDRLATAVTARLADAAAPEGDKPRSADDGAAEGPGEAPGGGRPDAH